MSVAAGRARAPVAALLVCCMAAPLVGLLAGGAVAHESENVLSTVEVNPRTGRLEVIHRFVVHDVEHALRRFDWGATDVLAHPADRERFARYVHERFGLKADGERVPLTLLGQELEGRYLWVYQEAEAPAPEATLTVANTVLAEPPRHHLVKVRFAGFSGSLFFEPGVAELSVAPAATAPAQ